MGEQNTDGYDIDVTVVEGMDEETLIRVEEIHPSRMRWFSWLNLSYRVIRIEDDCITEFKVINQMRYLSHNNRIKTFPKLINEKSPARRLPYRGSLTARTFFTV